MRKMKKKRALSSLVALSFLFAGLSPVASHVAFAAEDNMQETPTATTGSLAAEQKDNLDTNMTDIDKDISAKVNSGDAAKATLREGVEDEDGQRKAKNDLKTLNQQIQKESAAHEEQKNQTSGSGSRSYIVQDDNGNTITVRENPCYQRTEPACLTPKITYSTDSEGKRVQNSQQLNTVEYDAGDVALTQNMLNQIRTQKAYMKATEDALAGDGSLPSPNRVAQQALYDMQASNGNISNSVASSMAAFAAAAQQANNQNLELYRQFEQAKKNVNQALVDVSTKRLEEDQTKENALKQDDSGKQKRFNAKLSPAVPYVGYEGNIMLTLQTPSGKQNDRNQYQIWVKFKNQNTGDIEAFEVFENTPILLEKAEWEKKPGARTIFIFYKFKNNPEAEKHTVTYNIGSFSTAILPDGRNVSNSVTAMLGNARYLDYAMDTHSQGVAGRIVDVAYQDGVCMMTLTDAQTEEEEARYPKANVATSNIPADKCNSSILGTYASFTNVTAKKLSDGSYVFTDQSEGNGWQYGLSKGEYDAIEDKNAAMTQTENDKRDTKALRVGDDGTIYESLPGQLGINYVCFKSGGCVSVNKDDEGNGVFQKATGTPYTKEELAEKALPPLDSMNVGFDENGIAYVADKSGEKISIDSFSSRNVSSLSKGTTLRDLDTPNLDAGALSYGDADSQSRIGKVFSTIQSGIGNGKRIVTAVSRVASMTSPLSAINYNKGSLSDVLQSKMRDDPTLSRDQAIIDQYWKMLGEK